MYFKQKKWEGKRWASYRGRIFDQLRAGGNEVTAAQESPRVNDNRSRLAGPPVAAAMRTNGHFLFTLFSFIYFCLTLFLFRIRTAIDKSRAKESHCYLLTREKG